MARTLGFLLGVSRKKLHIIADLPNVDICVHTQIYIYIYICMCMCIYISIYIHDVYRDIPIYGVLLNSHIWSSIQLVYITMRMGIQ